MPSEPVAVALDVDDLAVVQESVEDGGGDHRIPKSSCQSVKLLLEVMILDRQRDGQVGLSHPGGPKKMTFSFLEIKSMSKSYMISFLLSWGWKLKSYSSMLLAVGSPAVFDYHKLLV